MGLIARVLLIAFVVLALMSLLRSAIQRIRPEENEPAPRRRTRLLSSLDRGITMVRRIAFTGLALVLLVLAAHMAINYA